MKRVPEDTEKPEEVKLWDLGWSILRIAHSTEQTEKQVIRIIQKYYVVHSKQLIEQIAENNVKRALNFLNIKTQRYQ